MVPRVAVVAESWPRASVTSSTTAASVFQRLLEAGEAGRLQGLKLLQAGPRRGRNDDVVAHRCIPIASKIWPTEPVFNLGKGARAFAHRAPGYRRFWRTRRDSNLRPPD